MRCAAIDRFASALSGLALLCHGGAVDCRAAPLFRSPLARCACARICSPMPCRCPVPLRIDLPLLCCDSGSIAFALLGLTVPCPCPVWPCHAYASHCPVLLRLCDERSYSALPALDRASLCNAIAVLCGTEPPLCVAVLCPSRAQPCVALLCRTIALSSFGLPLHRPAPPEHRVALPEHRHGCLCLCAAETCSALP